MKHRIAVGEKLLFFEKPKSFNDGCYLEALNDNEGFIQVIYLGNITQDEINVLSSEPIHTRMIKEGNKILFINKYGNTDLLFEVSFDPTLYNDRRAMQIQNTNNTVIFIGVERFSNTVSFIRLANFPERLRQELSLAWESAYNEKDYSKNYTKWLDELQKFEVLQLWEKAIDVGKFGEQINFS